MVGLRKALAGGLLAAALMAAGGAGIAAFADSPSGQSDEARGHGHGRWHHARGGHGPICGERQGAGIDRMLGLVSGMMTFTPPQATAFETLKAAVGRARGTVEQACKAMPEHGKEAAATVRLAAAESMAQAVADGLKQVRPAFDAFYGSLDEKQRHAIDELSQHRRHF